MAESTRNLNITPEEIESGKTMAFVAYLVFFIPLLMDEYKKNKFVMYHTEQSIVLLIVNLLVNVIGIITCGIGYILFIAVIVYYIIGIINAFGGKVAPLPLIGQFGEKFNLVK
ncbi:MAG: hypothetical protein MUE56_09580 [Ignavibacteria bacterium]|jgi:uncharacterized membrane protein|nr:hypothetical protein [Ignavibacteria bacterium]MCU0373475.1 hypothetical protein [Ignavibacteria bacterium]